MILNHVLMNLFSYSPFIFACELVKVSFSNESIKLDSSKVNIPSRTPRREAFSCGTTYDRFSVKKYLNTLNLGDTEDEYEAGELLRIGEINDFITLSLHIVNDGPIFQSTLDLNEELFAAAVESFEVGRLRGLLEKKKHLLLTNEQKVKVIDLARMNCEYDNCFTASGKILKMLLQAGFYPSDGIWPISESYPWISVFKDRRLYQPFLDYDGEFFAREKEFNYVAKLIEWERYSQAKRALLIGCDPTIIVDKTGGRNALDFALDVPFPLLKPGQEQYRNDLIRVLQEGYGMNISNTIENLEYICKRRDWDRAIELIRLGGMEIKYVSPIGLAFKYNNLALINAAIDNYLDHLTVEQLNSDLALFYQKRFEDEKQVVPFIHPVERIFKRINQLNGKMEAMN